MSWGLTEEKWHADSRGEGIYGMLPKEGGVSK